MCICMSKCKYPGTMVPGTRVPSQVPRHRGSGGASSPSLFTNCLIFGSVEQRHDSRETLTLVRHGKYKVRLLGLSQTRLSYAVCQIALSMAQIVSGWEMRDMEKIAQDAVLHDVNLSSPKYEQKGETNGDLEESRPGAQEKQIKSTPSAIMMLLYVVCAVEGLDLQLLPSSFKVLESQLGMTPTMLGALGMGQALCQATAGPVWGALADRGVSRKKLLAAGAAAWGSFAMCLGFTSNFYVFFALRCLDGAALACLGPICQSIIADVATTSGRGMAFGFIDFSIKIGSCVAAFGVTAVSELTWPVLGVQVQGWRVAFVFVGLLSAGICAAVLLLMEDPRLSVCSQEAARAHDIDGHGNAASKEKQREAPKQESSALGILRFELRLIASYFRIPSFLVILTQARLLTLSALWRLSR